MSRCPDCGAELVENESCKCGYDTDGGTATDDSVDAYVRKMRDRPYRERIAIRAGLRDPDDIEMQNLGIPLRVGLFVLGLVSLWLGFKPGVILESGVRRGGGLIAVVQSGDAGQLLVGALFLAFGILFVAVSYTGYVPKHGSETNRDFLP
jgi:hypothetical protein